MAVIMAVYSLISLIITARLILLINDNEIAAVSSQKGIYTINSISEYAGIYDCNMNPLVNTSEKYEAVVIPNHSSAILIQPYLVDKKTYYDGIQRNLPFLCEVTEEAYELGERIIIFKTSVRTDSNQIAPHIIGYTIDNKGMCGLEKSFDDFFRSNYTSNSATFYVDAVGDVLNGLDKETEYAKTLKSGIITTLDKNIQQICETIIAESGIKSGAVVVMDVKTGEIKSVVSYPDFDTTDISASMNNSYTPFINKAFSPYSLGSIFKLVTAAAALEQGISTQYSYTCTGSENVNGQIFNCHKWGGHGEIDLCTAIVKSCNTYFIALSEYLDKEKYIQTAQSFGFGQEITLCDGMYSESGTLQTVKDILIDAERANMSFGQGKLTATPLQICRMTAAIANNGVINQPVLIKGQIVDNNAEYYDIIPGERIISYETAKQLKLFMQKTVRAENSMSDPEKTMAAGKTSTAQTGWFDENGNELYNCWFTGYFPSYSPKYAVTVMVEDGISGNITAGPIFAEIADKVTEYEKSLRKQ